MPTRSPQKAPPPAPPAPPPARASGVALHRQLYLVLRDRIVRGVWSAGSALPTEEQLCEQFGVSRITVRRALSDLQAQRLVERRHGLGTFVSADVPMSVPRATLSFVDTLRKDADETQVRVIGVERTPAPPDIAAALELADGEPAVHAVRCRCIEDTVVMLTDAWVPARLGARITAASLAQRPLYELLMSQGVEFGRVVQEIGAQAADPRQATLLGAEIGSPLLRLVRMIHDPRGRPVLHLTALMPPEHGSVLMEITGERINSLSAGFIVHTR